MIRLFTAALILMINSILYAQSPSVEAWMQDIEFYKSELEKNHIDLYNTISKAVFEEEINLIKTNVTSKSDTEIIIDLMRLTRKIGDGHTSISLRGLETHIFPIEVFYVDGNWRVIKVSEEHKSLLGKKLVQIDDQSISTVVKEVSQVAQYVENQHSEIFRTGDYMMIADLLHGLGLTKDILSAEFSFVDDNGNESKTKISAINKEKYYSDTAFSFYEVNTPALAEAIDKQHDFLWFCPIKNSKAIYIKFESYPSFEEMEKFGESVLRYINQNQIEQVVIDLRNNGGGDFFVGTFLAYYLNLADSIDWKSGVYTLTDRVTFSAATSNAAQFRQMINAKIVGEQSGSNPTGYQDMGQFTLPNSGMFVTYSKRLFRFQERVTQGVQPDVLISYNWEDFVAGKDNMLDWIIGEIQE
jgi:hypothetical protein